MKKLEIDPFVQFVAYDADNRGAYIEALFSYLMNAEKNITMYLSSLNTVHFDAIFETEEEMYEELEEHISAKGIKYSSLVGLQTKEFHAESANKDFYKDADGRNKKFFKCNTFKHFKSCLKKNILDLYLEGRPYINNDNIVIIDDSVLILERYEYDDNGDMIPQNFLVAGDAKYIASMTANFHKKFRAENAFMADMLD